MTTRATTFTANDLRQALGEFATGVTIVTTRGIEGQPVGLTVNSFASVSLEPPLVLWSLETSSPSLAAFEQCSHYAVNVLAADQLELSQRFAQQNIDRFAGLEWREGLGGTALLSGCCASFECRNEARHPGGDHLILIGRVERLVRQGGEPLVFHGSRYRNLKTE